MPGAVVLRLPAITGRWERQIPWSCNADLYLYYIALPASVVGRPGIPSKDL